MYFEISHMIIFRKTYNESTLQKAKDKTLAFCYI